MKGNAACRGQEGDSRRKKRRARQKKIIKKTKKSRKKGRHITKNAYVDVIPCQFCLQD